MSEEIRYLGWKQPFASLMLLGKIETRTWPTKYRGLVLICASKTSYNESQIINISGEKQTRRALLSLFHNEIEEEQGKAIAVGRLVDCRLMTVHDEDKCFVRYSVPWPVLNKKGEWIEKKLYCHVYEDVKPIEPFEIKGAQGWRKLTPEIINKIKYL